MADLNAIVVDFGSSSVKFGHAGEATPRVFLNSSVGVRQKNGGVVNTDDETPFSFSSREHDIVTDFNATPTKLPLVNPYKGDNIDLENEGDSLMCKIYDLGMSEMFRDSTVASEHPLMFIDKCFASPEQRSKLAEVLFESCKGE